MFELYIRWVSPTMPDTPARYSYCMRAPSAATCLQWAWEFGDYREEFVIMQMYDQPGFDQPVAWFAMRGI